MELSSQILNPEPCLSDRNDELMLLRSQTLVSLKHQANLVSHLLLGAYPLGCFPFRLMNWRRDSLVDMTPGLLHWPAKMVGKAVKDRKQTGHHL